MKELETHLKVKGILLTKLAAAIYDASIKALPGAQRQPKVVNHRNADNQYLSVYGEEQ